MIIVIHSQVSGEERDLLTTLLCQVTGDQRSITATKMHEHEVIVLDDSQLDAQAFRAISQQRAVERVVQVHTPYKLVSRAFKAERSSIRVNRGESGQAVIIGGATATPVVMAGPCAVESREQLLTTARAVRRREQHEQRDHIPAEAHRRRDGVSPSRCWWSGRHPQTRAPSRDQQAGDRDSEHDRAGEAPEDQPVLTVVS